MSIKDAFDEAPPPAGSARPLWLSPDAVIATMAKDGHPIATGWEPLDRQLRGGGIRPGRVVGIGGPAFSGKTTIVVGIALHVAQEIPVFCLFSDEGWHQAAERMGVQLGVPLDELEGSPEIAAGKVGRALNGRRIHLIDPGRGEATAEAAVAYAIEQTPKDSTAMIVLDSIQTIRAHAADPDDEESTSSPGVRRLMKACRSWADKTRFIFLLASWVTRESYKFKKRADNVHKLASFFGGASVEHCLDVGVCLDLPDDEGIVPVEVPKNRLYKHGASKRFNVKYDEGTGRMLELDAPAVNAADQERQRLKDLSHEKIVSEIAEAIEEQLRRRSGLSQRQIRELVVGKSLYIAEALRGLTEQGRVEPQAGPRGGIIWNLPPLKSPPPPKSG